MTFMLAVAERLPLITAELAAVDCESKLSRAMQHVASAFGLAHFTLMNAPTIEDTLLVPLIIDTSLPQQFLKDFDRARLMRECPMTQRVRVSARPITWNLTDKSNKKAPDFPPDFQALLLHSRLTAGFVLPMTLPGGERILFWLNGDRESLSQAEINQLTVILLHAADVYNMIRPKELGSYSSLSARELEVIRWTSQGKTSIEIGQILSLSDHTVNAYMTNAIKKLDCVNRTQLVAKSIRLKLID